MTCIIYGDSRFAPYLTGHCPEDRILSNIDVRDTALYHPDIIVCFAGETSDAHPDRMIPDADLLVHACLDSGAHLHIAYAADDTAPPLAADMQRLESLARSYAEKQGLRFTVSRSADYATVQSALSHVKDTLPGGKTEPQHAKINQFNSSEKILRHIDKLDYFYNGHKTLVVAELDLTNRCNNKCPNCIGTNQNGAEMSKEHIDKVAESLREIEARGVILSGGGEPLVSPYFRYAVMKLRKNGIKLGLNSNGLALTEENASVIADNCEYFRVSIDAASPAMYEITHGMSGKAFETVRENCRMFSDIRKKQDSQTSFGLGFLTGPDTVREMEQFVVMACDVGADFAQFRPYQDDKTDVLREIESLQGKYNSASFKVVGSTQKYKEMDSAEKRPYLKCMGMWFSTVITADLGVYACLHYRQSKQHLLGSLEHQSLSDIFRSARMREVYEAIDCGACPVRCRNDAFNRTLDTLSLELINIEFL